MAKTIQKMILHIGFLSLLALIAFHGYFARQDLQHIRESAALGTETSLIQADISSVLVSFLDMETGQRGYLVTGDTSYLQPYTEASSRLETQLADLRSRLARRPEKEKSLESQLESVARAKTADIMDTIRFRQQGYRHRAFLIINSGRGKQLMDEARTLLASLSLAESNNFASYQSEMAAREDNALRMSRRASYGLLALTVVLYGFFLLYVHGVERDVDRTTEALRDVNLQCEGLTFGISHDVRGLLAEVRSCADALLDGYSGFLPRQAQELAQRTKDAATNMDGVLESVLERSRLGSASENDQAA